MLKIRLQRTGRINSPSYRVIVAEHTRGPKTGNFVEVVGTYDPKSKARSLDTERIRYWISVGAQPSATMHNMLISAGITTGKKINVLPAFVAKPVEPAAEVPTSSAEASVKEEEIVQTADAEALAGTTE
ncbi:MAG TPA: 30S ribosomal protein S16 [Candidatus Paceibacterota bacterium]|nr:30S ribosomal protein S16 [Candidatus Paceibacterota bacterium]